MEESDSDDEGISSSGSEGSDAPDSDLEFLGGLGTTGAPASLDEVGRSMRAWKRQPAAAAGSKDAAPPKA